MTLTIRPTVVAALTGLVVSSASGAAWAQAGIGSDQPRQPASPYRGLFGASSVPERTRFLDLNASLGAGYDDNIFASASGGAGSRNQYARSGYFGTAQAGLAFGRLGERLTANASAGVASRLFTEATLDPAVAGRLSGSLSAKLATRNTLQALMAAAWLPYYAPDVISHGLGPLAADPGGPDARFDLADQDQPIDKERVRRIGAGVEFSRQLSTRNDLSLAYHVTRVEFDEQQRAQRAQGGSVTFTRTLTPHMDLHLGYGYREMRSERGEAPQPAFELHTVDVGIGYSRALSLSRRTTLSLGTGTTGLARDGSRGPQEPVYRLVGNVQLARQFGRTGVLTVAYSRGVRFIEGFSEAFLADTVTTTLSGYLGRRLSVSVNGGYRRSALSGNAGGFEGVRTSATAQLALWRSLGFYTTWFYYDYAFDRTAALPATVSPDVQRQGIRAGLSVWLPLLR